MGDTSTQLDVDDMAAYCADASNGDKRLTAWSAPSRRKATRTS